MIEDPVSQGLLSFGARMMSTPGSTGQAFGLSTLGAMDDLQKASAIQQQRKRAALYDQQMQMQMEQARQAQARQAEAAARQQAIEEAYRGAIRTPDMQAMQQFGGPTVAAANAAPGLVPQVDQRALIEGLMKADPMAAYQMMQPKPEDMKVVGDALVGIQGGKARELYRAPPKAEAKPEALRALAAVYGEGSPEYQQAARQYAQKLTTHQPGTNVNIGDKPPAGYRWKPDGGLDAIPGGPADKLPESQQKQVVGAQNTRAAITAYREALKDFKTFDAASPNARAAMGTKYNNMMLQAKEAYNLGVLNGPDLEILTSVITDPRSFSGAMVDKAVLDKQASELDRIMQGIADVSSQRTPRGSSGAAAPARVVPFSELK
jgi:hypothetical protein